MNYNYLSSVLPIPNMINSVSSLDISPVSPLPPNIVSPMPAFIGATTVPPLGQPFVPSYSHHNHQKWYNPFGQHQYNHSYPSAYLNSLNTNIIPGAAQVNFYDPFTGDKVRPNPPFANTQLAQHPLGQLLIPGINNNPARQYSNALSSSFLDIGTTGTNTLGTLGTLTQTVQPTFVMQDDTQYFPIGWTQEQIDKNRGRWKGPYTGH